MSKNKVREQLEKQFTVDIVDFYDDGESVAVFIFLSNEVNDKKAGQLWEDYNDKYENEEFDGAYEDYLTELNIDYVMINPKEMVS
jgi:hypothetical protein